MIQDDFRSLRRRAAHCRRLANILFDQRVASELSAFADDLEAEAESLETKAPKQRREHVA